MGDRNRLEHLEDGWIAFRDEDGKRWRHRDETATDAGRDYRVFVSDAGEERHYAFGERESHDATIHDLRDQLRRASPGRPSHAGEPAPQPPAA
jgi:hypothetical protein